LWLILRKVKDVRVSGKRVADFCLFVPKHAAVHPKPLNAAGR